MTARTLYDKLWDDHVVPHTRDRKTSPAVAKSRQPRSMGRCGGALRAQSVTKTSHATAFTASWPCPAHHWSTSNPIAIVATISAFIARFWHKRRDIDLDQAASLR